MQGFGNKLKNLRVEHHYTQGQIAKILGCTVSSISSYESEQRTPSFEIIIQYANFFHVSTDYILGTQTHISHFPPIATLDVSGLSEKEISSLEVIVKSMKQSKNK